MRLLPFLVLPLAWGCDIDKDSGFGSDAEALVDVGKACVSSDGSYNPWDSGTDSTTLAADAAAVVTVVLTDCESGSVSFTDFTCEVASDGSTLSVTSSATRTFPGGDMTADCNVVSTTCATPALTEGSWTVLYGGSTAFEVPHSGAPPCAEGAAYPPVY